MPGSEILFLLNSLTVGGSERKSVAIANALSERGYPVRVAYLNPPDTLRDALDSKIPVQCLGRTRKVSLRAVRQLARIQSGHPVRLIFCVNLHPLPYVFFSRMLAGKDAAPFVALINKSEFLPGREGRMRVYRHILARACRVIFGCSAQQRDWTARFGIDAAATGIIYNGVDLSRFDAGKMSTAADDLRRSLAIGSHEFVIGCVGQLRKEKQHTDLVRAARQVAATSGRSVRLLLIGDGAERVGLQQLVDELGMRDSVNFLGELADPRPALQLMDVFALASVAVETFSNAALEAMAMGRAVVLSDIGGAREMIEHGVDGMIYPKGDVQALTRCLLDLCHDPELRQALGRAARRKVETRFSGRQMFDAYASLIEEVAGA